MRGDNLKMWVAPRNGDGKGNGVEIEIHKT